MQALQSICGVKLTYCIINVEIKKWLGAKESVGMKKKPHAPLVGIYGETSYAPRFHWLLLGS